MEINGGVVIRNETNQTAMGGSELIALRIVDNVDKEILKEFQIVNSRVRGLDENKFRILVLHDLPGDPESEFLRNGGWKQFHKIVCVSNWQMQLYNLYYGIPHSHFVVIPNAIEPIETDWKEQSDVINLAYWSTPHRGLDILVPTFENICNHYNFNIHLDVYSSFKLYGWEQRDAQYEELFQRCKDHDRITYHGTVPNEIIRENLKHTHILAYPNTWQETSCLVLIEAMSAGLVCVHPNLGALPETALMTNMYQWHEDPVEHQKIFENELITAIHDVRDGYNQIHLPIVKELIDSKHNLYTFGDRWHNLLLSIITDNPSKNLPQEVASFNYQVNI